MSLRKFIYNFFGFISLILGIIGAFLPLLPTTPFLLLSGYLFSKGSKEFHDWLLQHKYFGPPIHDWKSKGIIRRKHKLIATLMLVISSFFMLIKPTIPVVGKVAFVIFISVILTFIWSRPSE